MENATTQLDEIIRSIQKRRKSRRGGGNQHKIRRELWMGDASVQSNGWLGPVKGLRHHASHLFSFIEVFLKHWLRWALRC